MGTIPSHEDITMITSSMKRWKLKWIFKNVMKGIYEIFTWILVVMMTLFLGSVCILHKITNLLHIIVFTIWDKYMDCVDRKRIIKERNTKGLNEDYLVRYYLFIKGSTESRSRKFPFNVYLHKFLKSDDPIMHDHPWPYITTILSGGYKEHMPVMNNKNDNTYIDIQKIRYPGYRGVYSSTHKHWVELLNNTSNTWTLFISFAKRSRIWGFYPNMCDNEKKSQDTFIPYNSYLGYESSIKIN